MSFKKELTLEEKISEDGSKSCENFSKEQSSCEEQETVETEKSNKNWLCFLTFIYVIWRIF